MKILIIEDENLLAKELTRTLAQIRNDIEIIGRVKGVTSKSMGRLLN